MPRSAPATDSTSMIDDAAVVENGAVTENVAVPDGGTTTWNPS